MKITSEKSLRDFEFWSGAEDNAKYLTYSEFDEIEQTIEELYPEGIDETNLNDLFWFEFDTVCEWIGETEEEVLNR
jgi:hypothetical protein